MYIFFCFFFFFFCFFCFQWFFGIGNFFFFFFFFKYNNDFYNFSFFLYFPISTGFRQRQVSFFLIFFLNIRIVLTILLFFCSFGWQRDFGKIGIVFFWLFF